MVVMVFGMKATESECDCAYVVMVFRMKATESECDFVELIRMSLYLLIPLDEITMNQERKERRIIINSHDC